MCLLIALSRVIDGSPLVIATNRDEAYNRPSTTMTVLQHANPRILGGRDELAGGTWMATNEYGLVAALTNRPQGGMRDPLKRSRGELPIALAQHQDAASAVEAFVVRYRSNEYNPCWILVGDRDSLFYIDVTTPEVPFAQVLPSGTYVLENNPLFPLSEKSAYVTEQLSQTRGLVGENLLLFLRQLLGDHAIPSQAAAPEPSSDTTNSDSPPQRQLSACCVHSANYGTRSSAIVVVDELHDEPPRLQVADGHPCTTPFRDVTDYWITAST